MAKLPPDDPRVTDLRRYRKAREQARKVKPNPKAQMRETILGANPKAGVILVVVVVAFLALYVAPMIAARFF